jgi:type I restriction enzyme S subunit
MSDWTTTRIGDLLRPSNERSISNDQYPVLTSSRSGLHLQSEYFNRVVASKDNTGYKVIRNGQFTYRAMSDDGFFRFNRLTEHEAGIISPAYEVFECNTESADPAYMDYLLNSGIVLSQIYGAAQGGTRLSLRLSTLSEFEAAVPPLPKQKKIAEILSGIDKAIHAKTKSAEAIGKTSRFIAEELFEKASSSYDSIKIGDCTHRLWQGINTAADKVEYHGKGVPILQAKHITGGQIETKGARYLSEADYLKYCGRYQPDTGDILFTNIGTIGKSALVHKRSKFLIAWNIFLISPGDEILSEYLHYFLQVLDQRNYFHEHAAGNATKFINKTLISELEIPLPPKERQGKICDQIRAMKKAEQVNRDASGKYHQLKASLSRDLLSGRKRVSV